MKSLIAVFFVAASAFHTAAHAAETWKPTKPITLIVGAGAGTTPDNIARLIADAVGDSLGQPIIIENKPGMAGGIGVRNLVRSEADGHTLAISTSSIAGLPAVVKDLGFDPVNDVEHIVPVASTPRVFAVHQTVPADTWPALVETIKKNPNLYHYGGVVHALEQFQIELLKKHHNIEVTFVPYKTGGQMFADFLGQHVKMITYPLPELLDMARAGKIKIMAHSWHGRLPELPGVPTWQELGYPDMQISAWYGIVAPKGTPLHVQKTIADAVNRAVQQEQTKIKLNQRRFYPIPGSSKDLKELTNFTTTTMLRVGKDVGLLPQ